MARHHSSAEPQETSILNVSFEHLSAPTLGIGTATPRISWAFAGQQQSWMQCSYDLQIHRTDGHVEHITVDSSESRLVPWPGKPLSSGEKARVQVRAKDQQTGRETAWSEVAVVEAGLLTRSDWKARLVEPACPYEVGPPHRPVTFSRSFEIETHALSARLYITSHGIYKAAIDDQPLGDHVLAPGWTSYNHRLVYQTFDVTPFLSCGGFHKIGVDVGEGWYCGRLGFLGGRSNIYGTKIGLMAQLVVHLANGSHMILGTDDEWSWSYGPVVRSGIYDGEEYDARESGEAKRQWHPVQYGVKELNLIAPAGPPVRRTEELMPQNVTISPSGKTILDFGQNFVGWVRINVRGSIGTKIHLQFTEVLEHGECATRPLRGAKARDTIILSGEELTWEPSFTYHGFRYVQVENWPGDVRLQDFVGVVVHTDMERTGSFACSNLLLNKLHENIVWSMRGNFVSIPTDCPQRDERLGWTGDINVFADTAGYLYDTAGILSSWLQDLTCEQNQGIPPLVVPNVIEGLDQDAHAVWGDVAVMLPYAIYMASGDMNILRLQYDSMTAWLEAIPRDSGGLWNYKAQWKLGDWLDPAAPPDDPGNATTDPNLVSDAFLIHSTEIMAEVSKILGHTSDWKRFSDEASNLREAFAEEYITTSGRLVGDTQTAFALGVHFDLLRTEAQRQRATARLETLVRHNSRFRIATGFAGTPYIGHALTKLGLSSLFYRMLLHRKNPSWLYPVTMGATTIWERWDSLLPDGSVNPGEMTSFNHYALGAVADWMHKVILGPRPIEPGWKSFAVEPIPGGGLTWAEGSYRSCYGTCHVRWELRKVTHEQQQGDEEMFWITVQVPPNTSARVSLPGQDDTKTVHSGIHEWSVPYTREPWPPRALYPPNVEPDDILPVDPIV